MQGSKGIIRRLDAHEPEARPLSKPINDQAARCSRSGRGGSGRKREHIHVLLGCWEHTLIENPTPPLQSLPWPVILNASLFCGSVQIRHDPECLSSERSRHWTSNFNNLVHAGRLLPEPCSPPEVIAFCSEGDCTTQQYVRPGFVPVPVLRVLGPGHRTSPPPTEIP